MNQRIVVTFLDSFSRQRLMLLSSAYLDQARAVAAFNALPAAEGYSAFVASVKVADGKFEHRPLDREHIEVLAQRSLASLLAAARSSAQALDHEWNAPPSLTGSDATALN